MRLTEAQYQKLTDLKARLDASSGFKITRASIMLKLMEFGLSRFEEEFLKEENTKNFSSKKVS